ncbi:oxygenase MpaB family protein [Tsukamurella sp. 8F]|uniref:oxygenase MpaB family protein n=1 Tax=unclassified Tsukamurella TaxID=2633480 RepID=UPI0023B97DAE|nr:MULTISPECIES: oxygenase MpaB family protein [unclassified Tsukamurella]MDF0530491.1 oxygenase MpaB family protein [Tsukamurella sp. 8J]MDF0587688.1 oxygenase MpaB family protein [Tsukamurella sp. 8F]
MTAASIRFDTRINHLRDMQLSPWADVGDPLAEAAVAVARDRGGDGDLLARVERLADAGEPACRSLLASVENPPSWVDLDRIAIGADMALRHFPQYTLAVGYGALMTTFSSPDAAYILSSTGRFEEDAARRLQRSSALFFGVLDAAGLATHGTAWAACMRVRLIHSAVRLHMTAHGQWPFPGKPVSALQTSAGPLFFGAMMLDRLRRLGARITPDEADGFYLLWRYVTWLLGVPDELLGETAEEQAALDARILPFTFAPDDNSRRLARIALDGMLGMPGADRLPRSVHETIAAFMLGPDRARQMGLPAHRWGVIGVRCLASAMKGYGAAQRIPAVARATGRSGRRLLL